MRRPAAAEGISWLESMRHFPGGLTWMKSALDLRKSGSQGSMGRCAHRPCCSWIYDLRVRLTKPPQIAEFLRVGAALRLRRAFRLWPPSSRGDWRRFRAAGRRPGVHPTCGRARVAGGGWFVWRRADAGLRCVLAVVAGWMNVFSAESWQEFQLMRQASNHDFAAHNF